MTWTHRRLVPALGFSLLLHALPLAVDPVGRPQAPKSTHPLEARLQTPPAAPASETPPLMMPEPPPPRVQPPRRPRPAPEKLAPSGVRRPWLAEVQGQLQKLDREGRFYPEAAIAQGLEGEVLVLLLLDEAGNAVAARIERSSGYAILDDAALRAARSLKSLPAEAPRETLLPVRFRLR